MKLSVSISGFSDLEKQFKYLQRAAADALEMLATDAAIPIETATKENIQANGSVVSGTMLRSVHHETIEKKTTSVTVAVGPDTPYARRVEMGFVGEDSLGRHYNQGPRPFLRPAFDANQEQAIATMTANMRETISDALFDASNTQAVKNNNRRSSGKPFGGQ